MENNTQDSYKSEADNTASARKKDHIDLAMQSRVTKSEADNRFFYEPILSAHPGQEVSLSTDIGNKTLQFPIWVSSMTGGTEKAAKINENLARVCGEFGLGMGLGSCRQLLYEDKRLFEFDLRKYMDDQPLYINLGVAQVEELLQRGQVAKAGELIEKLNADGLIIHVNPLQEWLQPEGDRYTQSALDTIIQMIDVADYPIIVKEVGQGFGYTSLRELLKLPLEALDLAGLGGTNFSMLELIRSDKVMLDSYKNVCQIGHSCEEMIDIINGMIDTESDTFIQTKKIIISGGVTDFLDGYYLMGKCKLPSFYAQASAFLKYAMDYDSLRQYTIHQIEGLKMANAFLTIKA